MEEIVKAIHFLSLTVSIQTFFLLVVLLVINSTLSKRR